MGALYFMTGSCGSGKSTLLEAVKAAVPGLSTFHSDDLGVPPVEEMVEKFGSPDAWQAHRARELVDLAAAAPGLIVVEGQARPHVLAEAARQAGVSAVRLVLVDCGHAERRRRLLEDRLQPELDVLDTYAWAAYLRGQADVLGLEIIDTTHRPLDETVAELRASIARVADESGVPLESPASAGSPAPATTSRVAHRVVRNRGDARYHCDRGASRSLRGFS